MASSTRSDAVRFRRAFDARLSWWASGTASCSPCRTRVSKRTCLSRDRARQGLILDRVSLQRRHSRVNFSPCVRHIELDGKQHFWEDIRHFSEDGCRRDLLKEEFAMKQGLCVVRVLQEDVWVDRYGWQGWIVDSIAAARTGAARVLTPDAPEYRSCDSVYVRMRAP